MDQTTTDPFDWSDVPSPVQPPPPKPAKQPTKKLKPVRTGVFFHVPATFDASTYPELEGLHNEAHWLLNKVISTAHMYRHEVGANRFGVPISRQTMRTYIDPEYQAQVKDCLIKAKVLDHCPETVVYARYNNGKGNATEYRLNEQYVGDLRRVECDKRSLARKILANRIRIGNKITAPEDLNVLDRYLEGMVRRVRIDAAKAYEIIESTEAKVTTKRRKKARRKVAKGLTDYLDAIEYTKACNKQVVDQIVDQHIDYSRCSYGRLHTPVTRLLTEVRSCLSLDGQSLGLVDVKNSQVVFFAMLLLESFWQETSDSRTGSDSWSSDHSSSVPCSGSASAPSRFGWSDSGLAAALSHSGNFQPESDGGSGTGGPTVKRQSAALSHSGNFQEQESDQKERSKKVGRSQAQGQEAEQAGAGESFEAKLEGLPDDAIQFVKQAIEGTIYDRLMVKVRQPSRKAFKPAFFGAVLFNDPTRLDKGQTSPEVQKLARVFEDTYPTVWRFVRWMKRTGYENLARQMQARESDFMISTVCERLRVHHPEIQFVTIHDAVMAAAEHLPTVDRIIKEEFRRRLGVVPATAIEYPQHNHTAAIAA